MTCVGGFFGLDFIRAIKSDPDMPVHLTGMDSNPNVVAKHYVDSFYSIKTSPENTESYTNDLLEVCKKESIQVLLPSADEEVLAVSLHADKFKALGIQCSVEPKETVLMLRDKIKTFQTLEAAGLDIPKYCSVQSTEDVKRFADLVGYPDQPFILKPNTGRGARGLFVLDASCTELERGSEARGYDKASLDLFLSLAQKEPNLITDQMAMEMLYGNVHDVDCLSDQGKPVCILVRERLTTNQFSRGVEGHEIIENDSMKAFVTQAIQVLNFNNCNDFDFLVTKDGKPGLIEINPRWSGSVIAGVAAGVNYPNMLIRKLMGIPLPNINIQTGVKSYSVNRLITPIIDQLY